MSKKDVFQCVECRKLFPVTHEDQLKPGTCCSRHCARIRDARRGKPSQEDMEARFLEEIRASYRRIFYPKDKD